MVVVNAVTRADYYVRQRCIGNTQARRPVAVVGLHELIGELAVGTLRRGIDRGICAADPPNIDPLVRIAAGALAPEERPEVLRLLCPDVRGYGRVISFQIHVELSAQGVVPGWCQLITQAGGNREIRQEFVVVVEV